MSGSRLTMHRLVELAMLSSRRVTWSRFAPLRMTWLRVERKGRERMKDDEMEGNESQEWYLGLRFLVGGRGFFRFRFRREGEACFSCRAARVSL